MCSATEASKSLEILDTASICGANTKDPDLRAQADL